MKNVNEIKNAMDGSNNIALATSIENVPNVRIVNFVWDEKTPNKIYFTSDAIDNKVKEFFKNSSVAITTIPNDKGNMVHLRSNNAIVIKSEKTIDDVKDMFIKKVPSYGEALDYMRDTLQVFEIQFKSLNIIVDYDKVIKVEF